MLMLMRNANFSFDGQKEQTGVKLAENSRSLGQALQRDGRLSVWTGQRVVTFYCFLFSLCDKGPLRLRHWIENQLHEFALLIKNI